MENEQLKKILIIDDDGDILTSLRNYLEDCDYFVFSASSGEEGLEIFEREEKVDAVIVDLRMTGMDGLEVLERIKSVEQNVPIIVLSGVGDISDVISSLRLGAWDYIIKPIEELTVLKHSLEKVIERSVLISENKNYQKNLERLVEERTERLEHELGEKKKIELQLRQRTEELESYSFVISHDLKEPLRNISAFSRFLEEDFGGKLEKKGQEYLYHIKGSVERMGALINDLLLFARIGKRDTEFVCVDVDDVIENARLDIYELIVSRNAELSVGDMPEIVCQHVWLKEVFKNLISNAIIYNDSAQPKIKISCKVNNDEYVFLVEDNGIGIEEKFYERIFELFRCLHPREKYSGTGAGLAISRTIINQHNGNIHVEKSVIGKGTILKFVIPKLKNSDDKNPVNS